MASEADNPKTGQNRILAEVCGRGRRLLRRPRSCWPMLPTARLRRDRPKRQLRLLLDREAGQAPASARPCLLAWRRMRGRQSTPLPGPVQTPYQTRQDQGRALRPAAFKPSSAEAFRSRKDCARLRAFARVLPQCCSGRRPSAPKLLRQSLACKGAGLGRALLVAQLVWPGSGSS